MISRSVAGSVFMQHRLFFRAVLVAALLMLGHVSMCISAGLMGAPTTDAILLGSSIQSLSTLIALTLLWVTFTTFELAEFHVSTPFLRRFRLRPTGNPRPAQYKISFNELTEYLLLSGVGLAASPPYVPLQQTESVQAEDEKTPLVEIAAETENADVVEVVDEEEEETERMSISFSTTWVEFMLGSALLAAWGACYKDCEYVLTAFIAILPFDLCVVLITSTILAAFSLIGLQAQLVLAIARFVLRQGQGSIVSAELWMVHTGKWEGFIRLHDRECLSV